MSFQSPGGPSGGSFGGLGPRNSTTAADAFGKSEAGIGYLRQVQPADTAMGNLVFDAPPARYQLRLADEEESKFALVDLPLSFAAETPDLLPPGSLRKDDLPPGALKRP